MQWLLVQGCHPSSACAADLGSCVCVWSAGKAGACGVAAGVEGYSIHAMNLEAQTPRDCLSAIWQTNGAMLFEWYAYGSRLGSTQASGHTHSTDLAVWLAHHTATAPFASPGISSQRLHSNYALHCLSTTACVPVPVHIIQAGRQWCCNACTR